MRFFSLLLLLASLPALVSAALEFEQTRIDFKPADDARSVDVEFRFKNTGKDPVKVAEVVTSCGCTVPKLDKKDYAPGETGILKVHFEIGGRQGLQSKGITVRTDAGDQALQLVVDLPQRLVIEPRLLVFTPKQTAEQTLNLAFRTDAPVSNVALSDAPQPFVIALVTDKAGHDYTVSVKLLGKPTADQRATIFVRSKGASGIDYTDAFYLRYAP